MEKIGRMVEKVCRNLEKKDMDRIIVSKPSNISYLTGRNDLTGIMDITREGWKLYLSKFYRNTFKTVSNVEIYDDKKEKEEIVGKMEGEFSDCEKIMGKQFEKTETITEMRKIKEKFELKRLKKAAETGDKAYKHLKNSFQPGMTEWQAVEKIDSFFRREKCYNSFETLVHRNTLEPHRKPVDNKIREGDLVITDLGCRKNNYCSDMTRMLPNNVSEERKKLLQDLKQIQEETVEQVKEGKKISELCEQVNEKVVEKGYSVEKHFLHSLGHGVGVEIHEKPFLNVENDEELVEGNVVTIEPGLYVPGVGGVRIEDTVIVKKKECETVTRSRKQL